MNNKVAIELNDSGIIVSDSKQILLTSPGYIVDLAGQEWIGEEARIRAQLHSSECNHRFWSGLAQTRMNEVDQRNAKLALRHLDFVWSQVPRSVEAVILVVPATFTKPGLGLLLGICKELAIPVRAMVHKAVLVPQQLNHAGATIHLDIQLHQTAMTLLHEQQEQFSVAEVEMLNDLGFVSIYAAAAEFISQVFISASRLDPMHNAELEQQLFNNLPTWLEQAQSHESVQCQLEYKNSVYKAVVNAGDVKEILKSRLDKIIRALQSIEFRQPLIVCVSEIVNRQLGFNQYANHHGIMVRELDQGYHARQSLFHASHLMTTDAQIYLSKQLPCVTLTDPLPIPCNKQALAVETEVTHVLYQHHAYPLEKVLYLVETADKELRLSCDRPHATQKELLVLCKTPTQVLAEIAQGISIEINGQSFQSHVQLAIGDSIKIKEHKDELMLISVEQQSA